MNEQTHLLCGPQLESLQCWYSLVVFPVFIPCPLVSAEHLAVAVPVAVVAFAGGFFVSRYLSGRGCKKSQVNTSISKDSPKVVHSFDMEDIGTKAVYCRCWKSKKVSLFSASKRSSTPGKKGVETCSGLCGFVSMACSIALEAAAVKTWFPQKDLSVRLLHSPSKLKSVSMSVASYVSQARPRGPRHQLPADWPKHQ